jgi:hypothetical protein
MLSILTRALLMASSLRMPAFFLRPASNITQTNFTGGYAEIDEVTANDTDKAYNANGAASTLEVKLSSPSKAPKDGTTTVRYRYVKSDGGNPSGSNNNVNFQVHVYQGATLIASDASQTASSESYVNRSFTPNMASVTDWSDLRLRFVVSSNSGFPGALRGIAISWAELGWEPD